MTGQPQLPYIQPDTPSGDSEEARAAYRERLREYLRDPEFRAIEGFPQGNDEAILTLSDPPYYTACPNPFLPEIIEQWQEDRQEARAELGLPDDSDDNGNGGPPVYHREPFASDVSEGKNNPIYNAHSYHTKVPHKAIMRYILHYTDPGDIVFDGFCGTGMTGVAAQLCADRKAVQELGYRVEADGMIYDEEEPVSRLGVRKAVLVDLSPAATFIAYNYNTPVDAVAFEREARRILDKVEQECSWMYETWHVEPASCRLVWQAVKEVGQVCGGMGGGMGDGMGDGMGGGGILPPTRADDIPLSEKTVGKMPTSQAGRMPASRNPRGIAEFTSRQADLPHWQLPGAHYFITFNTDHHRQLSPEARDIVLNALKFWDGERLDLIAAVVMPDHVHAVLVPREREPNVYWDLSDLMHSVKSYSANEINEVEGQRGQTVWRRETYDHIIRNLGEYQRVLSYIAYNPVKAGLAEVYEEYGWFYLGSELGMDGWKPSPQGRINYTVWSDVFVCPACGEEIIFWDAAVDKEAGKVRDRFPCPACGAEQQKRTMDRAWETTYDRRLERTVRRAKQVPVLINYSVGKKRHEKTPDADDLALIRRIEESDIPYWFPTDQIPKGDKTSDPFNAGITHVHHFYTRRNLWVLANVVSKIQHLPTQLRGTTQFWLTSALIRTTRMYKFTLDRKMGNVSGTLYVPSLWTENSPMKLLHGKTRVIRQCKRQITQLGMLTTGSANAIPVTNTNLVDYVFVDPPFGGNLMYSELNFLWEAWLGVFTDNKPEAVVNRTQRKRLPEYQQLMEGCFQEFFQVLKPGRWMTVEFHNSQNRVWTAIQEGLSRAGFVVADVRTFDKQQGSFNQVTATGAVKQDLIISAYKPRAGFERRFQTQAGTEEGAWDFVRQHLAQLPVVVEQDGELQPVAERQPYLLFDRMVAFHIQRGATVPLSAGEFYAGLEQRFTPRDGMYFLPDQVNEYDGARMRAGEVAQLALFVSDEKSAVQWLRQQLDLAQGGQPMNFQDIQPLFLRQLHQARHEALPELETMLEQNFLEDEEGCWYVPDPTRTGDLERLRRRALLREFAEYIEGRGQLRKFRTEAVRAGFADAWQRQDYATIVRVAERLRESVLQEEAELLMYYDNASLRIGE